MAPSRAKAGRHAAGAAPLFALYGEAANPGQELLHIEEVQSRSRLHHWEIQPHLHQGLHQILWIFRGGAEVSLDEASQTIEGPAAILVPPAVVHGFRFAPETDGLVLTLSARFAFEGDAGSAGEAFGELFAAPIALRFSAGDPVVARLDALMRELAAEFLSPDAAQSPATLWLARAVLWRLARARAASGPAQGLRERRDRTRYQRFLRLVEEHFLERWPLSRYADRLGLSTQKLNRLARAESGRSALEIVHERMTREACRRLYYVAAPAEKLGMELGFDDPAYFSRFFKRRTGMSPRRWREAHQAGY